MQALSQLSYSPKLGAAGKCTRHAPRNPVRVAPGAPGAGLYPSPSGMPDYRYDPREIEPRWQKVWADERTWEVPTPDPNAARSAGFSRDAVFSRFSPIGPRRS